MGEFRDFQVKNKLHLPANVILDAVTMIGVISTGCHVSSTKRSKTETQNYKIARYKVIKVSAMTLVDLINPYQNNIPNLFLLVNPYFELE